MADIQISSNNKRRKLTTPRIDLTPMVDLGFLLITFFMYTTTMAEPRAMEINQPFNPPPPGVVTAFVDTSTISFIPLVNHKVAYYEGVLDNEAEIKTTDLIQLRDIIITKQKALKQLPKSFSDRARNIQVLIKPSDECTYDDVVKILDEMIINAVQYYAMVDISEDEKVALSRLGMTLIAQHHDN